MTNYTRVFGELTTTLMDYGGVATRDATCPAGTKVLSGGFHYGQDTIDPKLMWPILLVQSMALTDDTWTVAFVNYGPFSQIRLTAQAFAICATVQ